MHQELELLNGHGKTIMATLIHTRFEMYYTLLLHLTTYSASHNWQNNMQMTQEQEFTTVWYCSTFFWQGHQYSCTIMHPPSNLPPMPIIEGFNLHALWIWIVGHKVDPIKHHCHCTTSSSLPDKDLSQSSIVSELLLSSKIAT